MVEREKERAHVETRDRADDIDARTNDFCLAAADPPDFFIFILSPSIGPSDPEGIINKRINTEREEAHLLILGEPQNEEEAALEHGSSNRVVRAAKFPGWSVFKLSIFLA